MKYLWNTTLAAIRAALPCAASIFYAGASYGIYKSAGSGATWS